MEILMMISLFLCSIVVVVVVIFTSCFCLFLLTVKLFGFVRIFVQENFEFQLCCEFQTLKNVCSARTRFRKKKYEINKKNETKTNKKS